MDERRTSLEFRILGPLVVLSEGREVPLGGPKQRALLAHLLLRAGRVVPRAALVDSLWGDQAPTTADHAVQVYVSKLRKILGPSVETHSGGYLIAPAEDEVDASVFEQLSQEGHRALAAGDAETAASVLREALALWRDRPLADLSDLDFVQSEIVRLEELRLAALEDRIEADLALGLHSDLVAELRELIDDHPLREGLRRQLMLALYRRGRQTEALDCYREWRQTLVEELGLEPSAQLKELQAAILRQDPELDVERPELRARRHLPGSATALIGRRQEIEDVVGLVRDRSRLVTLTGPGGVGKTRIAIQAAHEVAEWFPDGVFFVGLAPVRDPELVPSAITAAIGLQEAADRPLRASLDHHLRDRATLLVLDNFEHLEEAAMLVAHLLENTAHVKILVTSRSRLHVYGEHEYGIPSLNETEAVALFETRLSAVNQQMRAIEWDITDALDLCRRLDGLPLAIELAVARARELSSAEMLEALPARLALAGGGPRDLPARQRTLRATVEWSLGLLDEASRKLFARMSVMAGNCDLAAAHDVCGAERDALGVLVDKSLLTRDPVTHRYGMLQTIREVAIDQLEVSGESEVVRRRHAEYFTTVAAEGDHALRGGGDQAGWLERLAVEHDNFRAALHWCSGGDPALGMKIASELASFWAVRDHLTEGRMWLESSLAASHPAPDEVRAKALVGCGTLARIQGDFDAAGAMLEESIEIYRRLRDSSATVRCAVNLAYVESGKEHLERAESLYEEGLAAAREGGDERDVLLTLNGLADLLLRKGEYERARRSAEEAYVQARSINDRESVVVSAFNLAHAALGQERYDDAVPMIEAGLRETQGLGGLGWAATGVEALAAVLESKGSSSEAARLLGVAAELRDRLGLTLEFFDRLLHERTVRSLRQHLDEGEIDAGVAEGRQVEPQHVFAGALATLHGLSSAQKRSTRDRAG